MPIIRIEIEQLRHSVNHYMQRHSNDITEIVQKTLEDTLTEEWVKNSIQEAVNKTVQSAIDEMGDNWELKRAVSNALSKALTQMIDRT